MRDAREEQFFTFVENEQEHFYRFTYSYTKDQSSSMDITQDAILKAMKKLSTLRDPAYLKTWFYRILINESLSYLKRRKKELPLLEVDRVASQKTPRYDDLYQALNQLPEKTRAIFLLHYFEELTLKEISYILKMNLSTVKAKLYQGLKDLKKEMGDF